MDRIIALDSVRNGRDLGGLATRRGQTLRRGMLLLSANLSETSVRIYPNPTEGRISLSGLGEGVHEAILYSADGQRMATYNVGEECSIDLSGMARGVYLLQVEGQRIKIAKL